MNQDQSFTATFKDSVSNFSSYKSFLSRSFGTTLKYLYFLLLIMAFVGSIKTAITLIPQAPNIDLFVKNAKQLIQVGYPQELVVNIKKGQLTTNVPEPYFIDLPKQVINQPQPTKFHLITIDTQAKIEDFSKYQTGILLTRTAAVSRDDNNTLKVYPFKSDFNLKIDKNQYNIIASKVVPYLNYAKPLIIGLVSLFLIFSPFLLAGFGLIGKLIGHLIWALLFFVIAKALSKNLTYKGVYLLSFFGVSLPIVISTLQNLINLPLPAFAQGGTIVPLIVMLIKVYQQLPNIVFFLIMIYIIVKFEKTQINTSTISNPQTVPPPQPTPPTQSPTTQTTDHPTNTNRNSISTNSVLTLEN